jgi:hypothetical protein
MSDNKRFTAMAGVQIVRKNDITHRLKRLKKFAAAAMYNAKDEGDLGRYEIERVRLRTIETVMSDISQHVPIFIAPVDIEQHTLTIRQIVRELA